MNYIFFLRLATYGNKFFFTYIIFSFKKTIDIAIRANNENNNNIYLLIIT